MKLPYEYREQLVSDELNVANLAITADQVHEVWGIPPSFSHVLLPDREFYDVLHFRNCAPSYLPSPSSRLLATNPADIKNGCTVLGYEL